MLWSYGLAGLIKEIKMPQKTHEIPMSKNYFPGLLPIVGDGAYQKTVARYRKLFAKHPLPQNLALQRHLIGGILPGLAFYQVLRESGKSQESALATINQTFEILFSGNLARMKKLGSLRFIYPFLRLYIKPAMRRYPAEGWKIEWLQNDNEAIRFNMKSCFYHQTLSAYDAPELTASFCQVDDFIYGSMSPYITWERSKTIGRGATCCDFCFSRAKNVRKS
jgi:hypothetical protein